MVENLKLSSTQVDYSVTKKSKNIYDNRCLFFVFYVKMWMKLHINK